MTVSGECLMRLPDPLLRFLLMHTHGFSCDALPCTWHHSGELPPGSDHSGIRNHARTRVYPSVHAALLQLVDVSLLACAQIFLETGGLFLHQAA